MCVPVAAPNAWKPGVSGFRLSCAGRTWLEHICVAILPQLPTLVAKEQTIDREYMGEMLPWL